MFLCVSILCHESAKLGYLCGEPAMAGRNDLMDLASIFLTPSNATHRQCQALRVLFVGGVKVNN